MARGRETCGSYRRGDLANCSGYSNRAGFPGRETAAEFFGLSANDVVRRLAMEIRVVLKIVVFIFLSLIFLAVPQ